MENTTINEAIEQAVEVVATPNFNWKKWGIGMAAVGTVCAIGYGIYRHFNPKSEEAPTTDNVEVAKRDFLDEEFEEE